MPVGVNYASNFIFCKFWEKFLVLSRRNRCKFASFVFQPKTHGNPFILLKSMELVASHFYALAELRFRKTECKEFQRQHRNNIPQTQTSQNVDKIQEKRNHLSRICSNPHNQRSRMSEAPPLVNPPTQQRNGPIRLQAGY